MVDVGVYLPSNPDGKVIDIDRKSCQGDSSPHVIREWVSNEWSLSQAPFMATFKVRKTRTIVDVDPDAVAERQGNETHSEYDVRQQAIFKVGDDCRQDVFAL